ncbi:MAG: hypothetical protein ACREQN_06465 [Candidatus Binataceae bacterium]
MKQTTLWLAAAMLALMLCATAWISACGVKSAPVPPDQATPERIEDLRATASPAGINLAWSRPTQYAGGHSMHDLSGFVILRAEDGAPMRPLIEIPITDRERFQVQNDFTYDDIESVLGHAYRYEIISETTGGYRGTPSNVVEFTRVKPPPPPNPANFKLPTPAPLPTNLP